MQKLLTKEMSIKDIDGTDDRGAKIDYVLEDNDTVYLVELKTTKGSINSDQAKRYIENCYDNGKVKTFGLVLGDKLLNIMGKKFKSKGPWTAENLLNAFKNVTQADEKGKPCRASSAVSERYGIGFNTQILVHSRANSGPSSKR